MSTYSEKLKDPRWQKKRLEILSRDDFTCQLCGATEKTLHVHHLGYVPNRDPWDYPNSALLTTCHECHDREHDAKREAVSRLVRALSMSGADGTTIKFFADAIASEEGTPKPLTMQQWAQITIVLEAVRETVGHHDDPTPFMQALLEVCEKWTPEA